MITFLRSFLWKLKAIFKNPMILFVYGILSHWFITIFVTAFVVVYWVFKGLSDAGILQVIEDVMFHALSQTKAVAQYCVPKIADLANLWDCLQNTPDYVPTEEEVILQENIQNLIDPTSYGEKEDPYMVD